MASRTEKLSAHQALLSVLENRRNMLSTVITHLNGFTVSGIAAVWAILLGNWHCSSSAPALLWAGGITALWISLWRLYCRYLDNAIAGLYPHICFHEAHILEALGEEPGEHSQVLAGFLKLASKKDGLSEPTPRKLSNPSDAFSFVRHLVDNKQYGNRGHRSIDILAWGIVVIVFLATCWGVNFGTLENFWILVLYLLSLILFFLAEGLAQRNPTESCLNEAWELKG